MNKKSIKNFAIESRKKLIDETKYQMGSLGITAEGIQDPIKKAEGMEIYDIGGFTSHTIHDEEIEQRKSLVKRVKEKGYDNVVEEVAYTWFNRLIAIRFMEVNDYLPTQIRVLSSENKKRTEPDIVFEAPNVDLDLIDEEIEMIYQLKNDNKLDELFRFLFVKQCNRINEILPELFEKTADYTELLLSISFTNEDGVVRKLIDIGEDIFKEQVEVIGWLYQFYNTELKDETFALLKKRVKVTKERVPTITQLFTPDWIVRYMVENSLGRLWLEHYPDSDLKENWKYYLQSSPNESELPINSEELSLDDLKVIDPCMGSGHILVYIFDVLMDMYVSKGYNQRDAAELILQNNLYGLEIDDRAYQLAYFSVLMKARYYNKRILNRKLKLNLCSIQESNNIDEGLIDFVGGDDFELEKDLYYIKSTFKDAKEYGSIINVKYLDFERIYAKLDEIKDKKFFDISSLQYKGNLDELRNLVHQAEILSLKYDSFITNPPYMANNGMNVKLTDYIASNYNDVKKDLFSVFVQKSFSITKKNGHIGLLTPYVWMFIASFAHLREKIVNNKWITTLTQLEYNAFPEACVPVCIFTLKNVKGMYGEYIKLSDFKGIEVQKTKTLEAINDNYCGFRFKKNQDNFNKIPGTPIAYWVSEKFLEAFVKGKSLNSEATIFEGLKTRNKKRFLRYWFEVCNDKWKPYSKGGSYRKWYGNNEYVVNWGENGDEVREFKKSSGANFKYFFIPTITYSALTSYKFSGRFINNSIFGGGGGGITNTNNLKYILGFVNSTPYHYIINAISPTLNYEVGQIGQQPLIISNELKDRVDDIVTQNISISKADWDSFETSWDYLKHPLLECHDQKLDTSEVINLNERFPLNSKISDIFLEWQSFTETQFKQLKANEEELNSIFIDIYGLQDELTPKVDKKDITLKTNTIHRYKQKRTKNNAIDDDLILPYEKRYQNFLTDTIKEFVSFAVGCMFGRYSLDKEGLVFVGGQWDPSNYKIFNPDDDNIIPILDTEYFNDDIVGRFIEFVKITFGEENLEENLDYIANVLKKRGSTSRGVIRNYFLTDFYKDHVKTYKNHPIYWLFDSGRYNGFKALIYMHRYEPSTVARVRIDYLHETQKALRTAINDNEQIIETTNSPSEKNKAVKTKNKLEKQLDETRKYDEALAHVANKKISIDLDDGVKANYGKFQGVKGFKEGSKAKINLLKKI